MNLQQPLTDLGGFLCVSAVALILALWCWRNVSRLCGAGFVLAYVTMIATVFQLKLLSAQLGLPVTAVGMLQLSRGAPSGHAALALYVYGLAAVLFWRSDSRREARLGVLASAVVIAGVAITRVTLHTHSAADVLAGAAIGAGLMTIPAAIVWTQTARVKASTRGLLPAMTLVALLILISGVRISSGNFI